LRIVSAYLRADYWAGYNLALEIEFCSVIF
jgi:hypothetical protein